MEKRNYKLTKNGVGWLVHVFRDETGKLSSTAEESFDEVAAKHIVESEREASFQRKLFESKQTCIPRLNLDHTLTDEDAVAFTELHPHVFGLLKRITKTQSEVDLQLISGQRLAKTCLELAETVTELGQQLAACERELRNLESNGATTSPPQTWFDNWSEPLSLREVQDIVKRDPTAATRYHTTGHVTFAEYFSVDPGTLPTAELPTPPEAAATERPSSLAT